MKKNLLHHGISSLLNILVMACLVLSPFWGPASTVAAAPARAQLYDNAFVYAAPDQTEILEADCYALTLSHAGQGSDAAASPANSVGCPTGKYISGENISLSGASPSTGWWISGWTGTSNNSSTASTNTVTMPAGDHTAKVNYTRPIFWVWPKYDAFIETVDWPMNDPLTLWIYDSSGNLAYGPYYKTTGPAPWTGSSQAYARFVFSFDIPAGYTVNITDGVIAKTHTVTGHEITNVNPVTNIVSGVATSGSQVEIRINEDNAPPDFQKATTDNNGDWSIDFTGIYDIAPDSWVEARQSDNDYDSTFDGLANHCYNVTASASPSGGGSVNVPPAQCAGGYGLGWEAELTATPAIGYTFAGWSGDAGGTNNPLTIIMDGDKNITANFAAPATYKLFLPLLMR